jgi:hypothetical protein
LGSSDALDIDIESYEFRICEIDCNCRNGLVSIDVN